MPNAKDLLQLRELHQSGLLSSEEYVAALRKLTGQRPTRRAAHPASAAVHTSAAASRDLPLLFALAALAVVAAAVAIYFLVAA